MVDMNARHARRQAWRALSLMLLAAGWPVLATPASDPEGTKPDPPNVQEKAPGRSPVVHEQLEVRRRSTEPTGDDATSVLHEKPGVLTAAEAIEELAGVTAVRRAATAPEPVIRGLGWERVATEVDGAAMYGACPGRMDPPAASLPAFAVESVEVVRGLPSVTLGPTAPGGRIIVRTVPVPGKAGRRAVAGADLSRSGAPSGFLGSAWIRGDAGPMSWRAGVSRSELGDYDTASGLTVPASRDESTALLAGRREAADGGAWEVSALHTRVADADYPALPMDTESMTLDHVRVGREWRTGTGSLQRVSVMFGHVAVDHVMSNRYRPNRKTMEGRTDSSAGTTTLRAAGEWRIGDGASLTAGFDAKLLRRDAVRVRRMVSSGMSATDRIWPDARQDDVGLFGELSSKIGQAWRLRAGLRWDHVTSRARATGDAGLGGRTVLENYAWFYGHEALHVDRSEDLLSGNVLVERQVGPGVTWYAGLGASKRAAGITERYYAFAPAPGGFAVGNPALGHETSRELEIGFKHQRKALSAVLSAWVHRVDGFILPTTIARLDVNGDGVVDRVLGYVNTTAQLVGAELSGSMRVASAWSVPFAVSWVLAEDTARDVPMPEIPPLEARAALRWRRSAGKATFVELGVRVVRAQRRIDPAFGEDATPGYAVWHLAASVPVSDGARLAFRIDNLLDRAYHEHLVREALMAVGDLRPGDEIDAPGRAFTARLIWSP